MSIESHVYLSPVLMVIYMFMILIKMVASVICSNNIRFAINKLSRNVEQILMEHIVLKVIERIFL